jgi:hypothetical protein
MERNTKTNIAASLGPKLIAILSIGLLSLALPALAAYIPFNTSIKMNIGIGSAVPGQSLDVQGTARVSGNVGIGSSITDSGGSPRLTITSSTVEVNLQ